MIISRPNETAGTDAALFWRLYDPLCIGHRLTENFRPHDRPSTAVGQLRKTFSSVLSRCPICLRCFGSLLGDCFEFLAGPSSRSGYIRNRPGSCSCQQRSDDGFGIVTLSNNQKIAVARREVE